MEIWKRKWIFTTTIVKIICVSGKIGTGKTTLCKKLIHTIHTTKFHKDYIQYINIDNFVHNIHKKLNTNSEKLQKILFYSGNHNNFTTNQTWFLLNKKFKKLIISHISNILKHTKNNPYINQKLIIFDIAIKYYFTTAINILNKKLNTNTEKKLNIKYIDLDLEQNSLYKKLFLLKKQRNFSFQKTLKILQQQV